MGNSSSRKADYAKLEQRLAQLESLDKNRDGLVTKDEMDNYMKKVDDTVNAKYHAVLDQKDHQLSDAKKHIEELEKQVESLKAIHLQLENRLTVPTVPIVPKAVHDSNHAVVELSKERINNIVEELLANENVNIKYLPDFVERQIYRNVLNLAINVMDRVVNSIHIKFLGHQLVFDVEPVPMSEENKKYI